MISRNRNQNLITKIIIHQNSLQINQISSKQTFRSFEFSFLIYFITDMWWLQYECTAMSNVAVEVSSLIEITISFPVEGNLLSSYSQSVPGLVLRNVLDSSPALNIIFLPVRFTSYCLDLVCQFSSQPIVSRVRAGQGKKS